MQINSPIMGLVFIAMVLATPMLAYLWFTDHFHDRAFRSNTRRHFSRPSFSVVSSKDGLRVRGERHRDHSERTQASMLDWHRIERRLKFMPVMWVVSLIVVGILSVGR